MEIQFLGTGAGLPSYDRNVSSLSIDLLNEIGEEWLVDCGEGTQRQLLRTNISPVKIGKIFITHLHGDHVYGLPGLLCSISNMGRKESLDIYGPDGLKSWVLHSLRLGNTRLSYKLRFHVVEDGDYLDLGKFMVCVKGLKHDIESLGYKFIQKDLEGTLDVDKALSLGVPKGYMLGKLKKGYDVTLEDGVLVKSEDVVGEKKKGKVITVLGDTSFHEDLIDFVRGSDILVHEATVYDDGCGNVKKYGHSSNLDAVRVADGGDVGMLLMTHISARYGISYLNRMEKESQKLFSNSKVVNDFDNFKL